MRVMPDAEGRGGKSVGASRMRPTLAVKECASMKLVTLIWASAELLVDSNHSGERESEQEPSPVIGPMLHGAEVWLSPRVLFDTWRTTFISAVSTTVLFASSES